MKTCIYITYFGLLLLWLYPPVLLSGQADGSARIRLQGALAPGIEQAVSVKQIESIGIAEATLFNPYEKGTDRYSGVWFDQFIAHFAEPGVKRVTLKAIDDYEIEFTAAEWRQFRILLATRVNGQYIGFAEKGPMRIVFPDYDPAKKIYQLNLPKWMWMITQIEFE